MQLPKRPNFSEYEPRLTQAWEKARLYTPARKPSHRPYTILLPPPNANDPLHAGHAMYVVEDILCRYHRMRGDPTLFLPGTDHAGIETQYVFEKRLAERAKSRFDYDRTTLYQMINEYVGENRGIAKDQLKRLGFSLDWTREHYTLDPAVLETVFEAFRKLHQDGLIYRAERLVNFCPHCGTGFSNLEVNYAEQKDPLYYMRYGPFVVATVRPETKFGDTAVAVNPKDRRYQKWIGKAFTYQSLIGPRHMKVIADKRVDPDFGTGVVKITPGHDPNDFEIAQDHDLPAISIINTDGRLNEMTGRFSDLPVKKAREKVVAELTKRGDIVKIDHEYTHRIAICYRCKNQIEPLLMPQWYVKVAPLVKPVVAAVKKGQVKLSPPRFKKELLHWLKTAPDWNISRQIVWGPRLPAWYCLTCNPQIEITFLSQDKKVITGTAKDLLARYAFAQIEKQLQSLTASVEAIYQLRPGSCDKCKSVHLLQETDTFDTWFSSGQWPLTTLGFPDSKDFKYFYPTSVLDTMWDILPFWVMRMLMFGIYRTGEVPFEWVHLHSCVVDAKGKKMSKSLGNVINPIDMVEEYGADALRFALIFGTAPASDIPLGDEKLIGARNFVTKLWNMARFLLSDKSKGDLQIPSSQDKTLKALIDKAVHQTERDLDRFQFARAIDRLYKTIWHELADKYIERYKQGQVSSSILASSLIILLKLLHPFMPFITEELYQHLRQAGLPLTDEKWLATANWPKVSH